MVEVERPLAAFEGHNTFDALRLFDDESVPDVESAEEVLARLIRNAAAVEAAAEKWSKTVGGGLKTKVKPTPLRRSFTEEELDDGWTIVASRQTKRRQSSVKSENLQQAESEADQEQLQAQADEEEEGIPTLTGKPAQRKWKRALYAFGAAAAVGVATFLLKRRKDNNAA